MDNAEQHQDKSLHNSTGNMFKTAVNVTNYVLLFEIVFVLWTKGIKFKQYSFQLFSGIVY